LLTNPTARTERWMRVSTSNGGWKPNAAKISPKWAGQPPRAEAAGLKEQARRPLAPWSNALPDSRLLFQRGDSFPRASAGRGGGHARGASPG
jgi:hypothetical protein